MIRSKHTRAAGAVRTVRVLAAAAITTLVSSPGPSQVFADPPPPAQDWARTESRADCTNYNAFRNPYFGETHIHTKYSADAVLARTRNTPYDAYGFAKGAVTGLPPYDAMDVPLRTAQIERPLDFTAVTDHSEGFGEARICMDPSYAGYNYSLCQDLRATFLNEFKPTNPLPSAFQNFFFALVSTSPTRFDQICGPAPDYADCMYEAGLVWQDIQDAAEANYDRTSACTFTTFSAYEWSGQPNGNNLHRNIIFRNAEVPAMPISYYEKPLAQDMRAELKAQCMDTATNCDALAIPHNSNMATDKMFSNKEDDNGAMSAEYAELRAEIEPIMELTQVKGDSECRDGVLGTNDELCTFENNSTPNILAPKQPDDSLFSPFAYARGALRRGLSLENQLGVNPYQLGFVGSTDSHNGVPGATSEVDYGRIGQTGIADSGPAFILADSAAPSKVELNPGGLAVVWAEENSRDAIFSAMRRRETYSTSGTRPILRVFGGRVPADLCTNGSLDFVAEGYDKGVPMGGNLGPALGTKQSPRFAIFAQKDPGGLSTPLQRAQVIKGWVDSDGREHEIVYDVAGNPDSDASIDPDTCARTGTAGADTLCTVWEDPEFDATENAYYYVRIVEDPTCRWHKRLCNDLKTCSTHLQACSLDKTRWCDDNADCSSFSAGNCTEDYPAVCVNNADCEVLGAGTCGSTPAIDCDNPSTVPAAAAECCDSANPWTIQERAVASPIYYHPGYVGISKGKIGFKDTAGEDSFQLQLVIPRSPSELEPATKSLTLTLRDSDSTVWTATIPAGTMETKKPGSSYSYKSKDGAIAGITGLSIKISKGTAKIKLKTKNVDLSGITRASQKLSFDFVSGTYSSTADREWSFKDPKLSVTF